LVYFALSPSDLSIPFPGVNTPTTYIRMQWGGCFYLSVLAGLVSIVFG
jgi:hypothetical protein